MAEFQRYVGALDERDRGLTWMTDKDVARRMTVRASFAAAHRARPTWKAAGRG